MRNVLLEMGSEEQADSLNEEEVSIFHYYRNCRSEREVGVAGWGEGGCRKDKLPALINVPKKKLLEQTAKVDKV